MCLLYNIARVPSSRDPCVAQLLRAYVRVTSPASNHKLKSTSNNEQNGRPMMFARAERLLYTYSTHNESEIYGMALPSEFLWNHPGPASLARHTHTRLLLDRIMFTPCVLCIHKTDPGKKVVFFAHIQNEALRVRASRAKSLIFRHCCGRDRKRK